MKLIRSQNYLPKICVEKELARGSLVEVLTGLGEINLGVLLLKNANKEESAAASLLPELPEHSSGIFSF